MVRARLEVQILSLGRHKSCFCRGILRIRRTAKGDVSVERHNGWGLKIAEAKFRPIKSGRQDLNLRPLGPKPSIC